MIWRRRTRRVSTHRAFSVRDVVSVSIAAVLVVYMAAAILRDGATLRGWSLLLWIPILFVVLYAVLRIALVAVVVRERSKRRRRELGQSTS